MREKWNNKYKRRSLSISTLYTNNKSINIIIYPSSCTESAKESLLHATSSTNNANDCK